MTKKKDGMKKMKTINNIHFMYWLQGFFEIGKPKKITKIQLQEIKNHINEVYEKNEFIFWLQGCIEGWEINSQSIESQLKFCKTIKEKLEKCFEKVTSDTKLEDLLKKTQFPTLEPPRGPCFPHSPLLPDRDIHRDIFNPPKIYC